MMTKDELLKESGAPEFFRRDSVVVPMEALNKFFASNVCIPKCENRHPDADVLHAQIEGITIQTPTTHGEKWIDLGFLLHSTRYRIKPKEPIYEWQWLEDGIVQNLGFYIENELEDYPNKLYQKIEATKRERVQ
jgi:hypothetical protein